MNPIHRQNIEAAWSTLLEAIAEAAADAKTKSAGSSAERQALASRLETLHDALHGLSNAWTAIRDLLPPEPAKAPETSDVPGALPESAYWRPLAEALLALKGKALARDAITAVEKLLEKKLKPVDREPLPTGQVRWISRIYFSRQRLKMHGLILAASPRGLWELTEAGKRWAADPSDPPLPTPISQPDPNQLPLPI